jgi:hypothetical protein
LHPTPDGRVIRCQPALGEQFFDVAERERIGQIPAYGTQNRLRRRLPPLEDGRSDCILHDLFSLPATPAKLATHPSQAIRERRRLEDLRGSNAAVFWSTFIEIPDYAAGKKLRQRSTRLLALSGLFIAVLVCFLALDLNFHFRRQCLFGISAVNSRTPSW